MAVLRSAHQMRLAFFVGTFPHVSETFVLGQITGMIDRGHDVTVFADRPHGAGPTHPDVERYDLLRRTHYRVGLSVDRLRRLAVKAGLVGSGSQGGGGVRRRLPDFRFGKAALLSRMLGSTFADLPHRRFDAIMCHFGPFGLLAAQLRAIGALEGPIATAFHGYDLTSWVEREGANVYRDLFREGELFLPISRHWAKRLVDLGCPEEKVVVHRMGVDCRALPFRERALDSSGKVRLLSVARLVEKKGIEYAIEAVARLHADGLPIEYTVVGDGPLRPALKRRVAAFPGLESVVHLVGWKNQSEVAKALADSHILLVPSVTAADGDQEGIPVVLMEAMATGMPVVATRHSGIPELVEDGVSGYLAPERDADALADRIAQLAAAPSRWSEVGRSGRDAVLSNFDVEKLNDALAMHLARRHGKSGGY